MKRLLILCIAAIPLIAWTLKEEPQDELDQLIDNWHVAAAEGDFEGYFGVTTADFVFLGTAPEERWTQEEFMSFCKPYFDRGKAWDFKPSNRIWQFSKNGKTAWFDEDLDTWMRGCRGTGICQKVKGEWKIVYYNLHVLIENEKIDAFIELRDEPMKEE
ncbi:MAG: nuclear transport factor 2 family protein [Fluviicola sp.]